jgi:hypothetical protein
MHTRYVAMLSCLGKTTGTTWWLDRSLRSDRVLPRLFHPGRHHRPLSIVKTTPLSVDSFFFDRQLYPSLSIHSHLSPPCHSFVNAEHSS